MFHLRPTTFKIYYIHPHDFVSQALPLSRATLKSWVEPGDEAMYDSQHDVILLPRVTLHKLVLVKAKPLVVWWCGGVVVWHYWFQ